MVKKRTKVEPPVITSSTCVTCGSPYRPSLATPRPGECIKCADMFFAFPMVYQWVLKVLSYRR